MMLHLAVPYIDIPVLATRGLLVSLLAKELISISLEQSIGILLESLWNDPVAMCSMVLDWRLKDG